MEAEVPGSAALAPDPYRLRPGSNARRAADTGSQPQPVGIPLAGGAGWVPVYGVIGLPQPAWS